VTDTAQHDLGRLRWRCRRGMKELDVLLTRWLDEHHGEAALERRAAFERLLDLPDPDIAGWFLGRSRPADPELAALVDEILADRR